MYVYVPHVLDCIERILFIVLATPIVATVVPPAATSSMAALSPPQSVSPHHFGNPSSSVHSLLYFMIYHQGSAFTARGTQSKMQALQ